MKTANDIRATFLNRFKTALHLPAVETDCAQISLAKEKLYASEPPGSKDEKWKYTRIDHILKAEYKQAGRRHVNSLPTCVPLPDAPAIVMINGRVAESLSAYPRSEVNIMPLRELLNDQALREAFFCRASEPYAGYFTHLNTAFFSDGMFIRIPEGTTWSKPLQLIHITDGNAVAANYRHVIAADKNSACTIIQSYHTKGGEAFTNTVTEVLIGEHARVELLCIQKENRASKQIHATYVEQKRKSRFSSHVFSLGGQFVRNDLHVALRGRDTETDLKGLCVCSRKQHVDNHTHIDHFVPHCNSRELYKGVLLQKSTAVFNGKVHVWPSAQQTNAFQSNRNIILSDEAGVYSKPELEIYADDVKCSHGSATGKLDEEALFYLRSRGIPLPFAVRLLVRAFAGEVIEGIKYGQLIKMLYTDMDALLENKKPKQSE